MKPFQHLNHEFALNEIVFENRNKFYGAYDLRNRAGQYMNKALFSGILFFGIVTGGSILYTNLTNSKVVEVPPPTLFNGVIVNEPQDPVKPKDPEPVQSQPQKVVKTIDTQVPTPVNNPPIEKITTKVPPDAVSGTQNIEGPVAANPNIPAPVIKIPGDGVITAPPQPKVPTDEIVTHFDVEAAYVGGLDSFRNKIKENFDGSVMDGTEGVIKTMVTFIVERDGTITNIKADGPNRDFNAEAIRTIKSVKGKWNPAKLEGQNVRSYFRIPVSMKFE
ncbi:energy transducer TonB [Elizabethkingia ursingii]|uniref:Energy transducer TonB n=1 Tax=Elizabethkingia ursingii TaxID=1756150 RepID=A0ABX3N3Z4_9FLAO|nr:energy transducer TonB [Elizabethkingia ursingii]OPB84940.1 energy transducer TonB [Elizabethkingia ursingii]